MPASLVHASPRPAPSHILKLSGLFWAFSYVLLTIRGALFHDDWTRLIDDNRLLAVTVGAGAYFLVLKQLEAGRRITLRAAISWTFGATLAVMIVRLTVDELAFDAPQGIQVNLLWSLSWSAYFALWVMGSLAFEPATAAVPAVRTARLAAAAEPTEVESFELLVVAILAEAEALKASDRSRLAAKVLKLGGYESADAPEPVNERARLALRLAARLSVKP